MEKTNYALVATTTFLAAACSSLHSDVRPVIEQANIRVDTSSPTELADIFWEVTFDVDPSAAREVDLHSVSIIGELEEDPFELKLALSFPNSFDGYVKSGQEPILELENLGVTNHELAVLCDGEPVDSDLVAFVQIGFSEGNETYTPFATASYVLDCE